MLTTEEVARMIGVTPTTVLRYYRSKRLPGYRLGHRVIRYHRADVEAFIAEHGR